MRKARIKAEGAGYYHCMSRIIERRHVFGPKEKEVFLKNMRKLEAFCGLKILTHCVLSSHFHVLIKVPERCEIPDKELLRRLKCLYEPHVVKQVGRQLKDFREHGQDRAAEKLKARYTYRMYDISQYMKSLKQRFSQYYNRREGRKGPLWEQRFKSILVQGCEHALATIAAYIDLNPVRANLVADPKDYRYCGYGEAMGGSKPAQDGLRLVMQTLNMQDSWPKVRSMYRQHLYVQGRQKGLDPEGRPIKQGFTPEQVEEVVRTGGKLPMHVVLRCRVRYFSDGLALGSKEFIEQVFERHRDQFGPKRGSGARAMKHAQWGKLCTMRDLRDQAVSMS